MFSIKIDKEKCKSCKLCVDICPGHVFRASKEFNRMGYHYIETDGSASCTGCKRCVTLCPDAAIEIYLEEGDEKEKRDEDRSHP